MNNNLPRDLKIVVLDRPLFQMHLAQVRDLFGRMIYLKNLGYETEKTGYLASDETDYIATHFLACEYKNGDLIPLIGFKALSYNDAQFWKLPFYGHSAISTSKSTFHQNAIEEFINQCLSEDGDLGYTASLALLPELKDQKEKRIQALKIFEAMLSWYHLCFRVKRSTCIGRATNNAPKNLKKVGYEKLCYAGQELGEIIIPKYNNPYEVLVLNEVSEQGLNLINEHLVEIENCLFFGSQERMPLHIHSVLPWKYTNKRAS